MRNPLVAAARKLARPAERDRSGQFLLEGARGIAAALDAHATLATLLATPDGARGHPDLLLRARHAGTTVRTVTEQVMAAITTTATAPGLLAVAASVTTSQPAIPAHARLVCVLDGVADPGNAGTVLRTADAVGADALATTAGSVHPEGPKAARAAAGSLFHLPVLAGVAWPALRDACRQRGLLLIGADPHAPATTDTAPLEHPCALVLGNEAHGLSDAVRRDLDLLVRLPTPGRAESLNLAAAAAILLYETARRQAAPQQAAPQQTTTSQAAIGPPPAASPLTTEGADEVVPTADSDGPHTRTASGQASAPGQPGAGRASDALPTADRPDLHADPAGPHAPAAGAAGDTRLAGPPAPRGDR